jgi:hypothetical protein
MATPERDARVSAHTDMTPYDAWQITHDWAKSHGRDVSKLTSQTFYGLGPSANGTQRVIEGYRVDSKPHVWLYGDSFAAWFDDYRKGIARTRTRGDISALLAEYADVDEDIDAVVLHGAEE